MKLYSLITDKISRRMEFTLFSVLNAMVDAYFDDEVEYEKMISMLQSNTSQKSMDEFESHNIAKNTISDLKKANADAFDRIDNLERDKAVARDEISSLKRDNADAFDRIDNLERDKAVARDEISSLKRDKADADDEIAKLKSEIKDLKAQLNNNE